jgi:hypothetical protein
LSGFYPDSFQIAWGSSTLIPKGCLRRDPAVIIDRLTKQGGRFMVFFPHRHLLGIKGLSPLDIELLLDKADEAVQISRQREKKTSTLRGLTQINLFFEASTRTQASFELAGKRLGADVMNMSVGNSSVKKGETLIDTAMTLNAMHPDVLVLRHSSAGAAALLAQKVSCSVVNAGDGQHEHPTQALLDALTIGQALAHHRGDLRRRAAFARCPLQHHTAEPDGRPRARRRPCHAASGRNGGHGGRGLP